jgi:hypothetical protein
MDEYTLKPQIQPQPEPQLTEFKAVNKADEQPKNKLPILLIAILLLLLIGAGVFGYWNINKELYTARPKINPFDYPALPGDPNYISPTQIIDNSSSVSAKNNNILPSIKITPSEGVSNSSTLLSYCPEEYIFYENQYFSFCLSKGMVLESEKFYENPGGFRYEFQGENKSLVIDSQLGGFAPSNCIEDKSISISGRSAQLLIIKEDLSGGKCNDKVIEIISYISNTNTPPLSPFSIALFSYPNSYLSIDEYSNIVRTFKINFEKK